MISTANVTQSLSSSFSVTTRCGNWESRINRRSAILRSISQEETSGFLEQRGTINLRGLSKTNKLREMSWLIYRLPLWMRNEYICCWEGNSIDCLIQMRHFNSAQVNMETSNINGCIYNSAIFVKYREYYNIWRWCYVGIHLNGPDLSLSPEYFSTATSLGTGGGAGLGWEVEGWGRGSTGWKVLPILISTNGPLSSRNPVTKKVKHIIHHTVESTEYLGTVVKWQQTLLKCHLLSIMQSQDTKCRTVKHNLM